MKSPLLQLALFLASFLFCGASNAQLGVEATAGKTSWHEDKPSWELVLWRNHANQTWDSTEYYTYTYYPSGEIASIQMDQMNSMNAWEPRYRYEYFYDTAGINVLTMRYNNDNGNLVHTGKNTQTWNAQKTQESQVEWAITVSGYDSVRTLHWQRTYHPSGQVQLQERYQWDQYGQPSVERVKEQSFFNAAGNRDSTVRQNWENGAYMPADKWIYPSYTGALALEQITQTYDLASWGNANRQTYVYGQNGNLIRVFNQSDFNGNWVYTYREDTQWDQEDHAISVRRYVYNQGTWDLRGVDSTAYTYDAAGNTLSYLEYFYMGGTLTEDIKHVFADFFVSRPEAQGSGMDVTVFPNPANDQVHCQLKGAKNGPMMVSLYDLNGQVRVRTLLNYHGQQLNIPLESGLGAGVYILEVANESGKTHQRVQVVR